MELVDSLSITDWGGTGPLNSNGPSDTNTAPNRSLSYTKQASEKKNWHTRQGTHSQPVSGWVQFPERARQATMTHDDNFKEIRIISARLGEAKVGALKKQGFYIVNVTSKGREASRVGGDPAEEWAELSPYTPQLDEMVEVKLSNGEVIRSTTVEGLWQGLKIFENVGVEWGSFQHQRVRDVRKRSSRVNGKVLGHYDGMGVDPLSYVKARKMIYLPAYLQQLRGRNGSRIIQRLREIARERKIALVDFTINGDINDTQRPLSHAALVRLEVLGKYPNHDYN